jgi:hypothetical protein
MDYSDSVPPARIISHCFFTTQLCNSTPLTSRELLRPLFINASSYVSVTSTLGVSRAVLRSVLEGLKKRYHYCARTKGAYRPGDATSTLPLHAQLPRQYYTICLTHNVQVLLPTLLLALIDKN